MAEPYYLGIDAGQTHVAAVLLDALEQVHLRCEAGPSHQPGVSPRRVWHDLVGEVLAPMAHVSSSIVTVGVGATGVGTLGAIEPAIRSAVRGSLPDAKAVVANDAIAAWWSVARGQDCAVVIAGTGSTAYGTYAGQSASVGGYGYLLGDEGGASWIALTGVRHALRARDGRAEPTRIGEAACAYFDARDLVGVLHSIYSGERLALARIAGFARSIGTLADEGDAVAQALVRSAAVELAELAVALVAKLGIPEGTPYAIAPIGRTWQVSSHLLDQCREQLARKAPAITWARPACDPATGAALMGRYTDATSHRPDGRAVFT